MLTCSSAAPPESALSPVRLPSKAKVLSPWLTNCPDTAGRTPLQTGLSSGATTWSQALRESLSRRSDACRQQSV